MLKNFNSEIKVFLIAALFAIVLTVGGILLLRGFQPETLTPQDTIPPQVRKSFARQEDCEAQTGYRCDFVNCDINCPIGFQKGWSATDVKLEKEQVDTSTWQTYRNEEFEFKYPPQYFVFHTSTTQKENIVVLAKESDREFLRTGKDDGIAFIRVNTLKEEELLPLFLSDIAKGVWNSFSDEFDVNSLCKSGVTVDEDSLQCSIDLRESDLNLYLDMILLKHDNKVFVLEVGSPTYDDIVRGDFSKILSTFRFID